MKNILIPQELIDYIFLLTDFETVCNLNVDDNDNDNKYAISNFVMNKLYNKKSHLWCE
jgi:hypothetical protein